jgi:anti-sigma regulatory factor (Ser/Thr protein kinase)
MEFRLSYSANICGKLCFVSQSENIAEKIKNVFNNSFIKNFRNIGDAINYFYWECCKERDVIRMKMPSDIELVPSVRACISEFFSLCKIERKEGFQVEMIIDELCNNAIEHGTQDENKTIEVLCSVNDEQIEINVYNGYSLRATQEKIAHDIEKEMKKWALTPSEQDDVFRGRGLGLVRNFSDNYEINSSTDGTWVHVIKRRKGESNAKNAD